MKCEGYLAMLKLEERLCEVRLWLSPDVKTAIFFTSSTPQSEKITEGVKTNFDLGHTGGKKPEVSK